MKKFLNLGIVIVLFVSCLLPLSVSATKRAKSRISINKKKVTICVGEKTRLKVNTKKKIIWKTSKKNVAKVNKKGVVSGIKSGKATITAKVGKKLLKCKVTVKEEPKLEYDNYKLCVNDSFVLQFEGEPKNLVWSVEDESVVTVKDMEFVENAVMVVGLKYGSTNVVAKDGKKEYKCNVSVEKTFQMDESQMNVSNVAIRSFDFLSSGITVLSSNPSVAIARSQASILSVMPQCITGDIIVYGISSGTADITIKNDLNDEVVTFKVIVNKPQPDNAKQKLIDFIYSNGFEKGKTEYTIPNEYTDGKVAVEKYNSEQEPEKLSVAYDPYTDDFVFEYVSNYEIRESEKRWRMFSSERDKNKYYVSIDKTVLKEVVMGYNWYDLLSFEVEINRGRFTNEFLQFNDWEGNIVDEENNKFANEFHKEAFVKVDSMLKELINISISDL